MPTRPLLALASILACAAGCIPPLGPRPVFIPAAQFPYQGYYRTAEGHPYHYDRDRDGWHYGRTHEEGARYEASHAEGPRR